MKLLIQTQKKNLFNCFTLLSITIGIVYLWFGILKFFPHLSPAEDLAINTINLITFGLISSQASIILLAIWETTLGVLFILNCFRKVAVWGALLHLVGTFTPMFFFPESSFTINIFSFTLLGQYIVKNVIIVGALWVLYQYDNSRNFDKLPAL
ncbi:MAG: doxx family protein [Flavobacteriaceae bacterium]